MSRERGSGIGKFVLGAAIGAGLGILFAPKKGSETRAELKAKIDDLVEQAKQIDVEEVKAAIAAEKPEGHYILIKGSNSTKLYQLPELL